MASINTDSDKNGNLVTSTLEWITNAGVNGLNVLQSAEKVAADHLNDADNIDDAINSIIAWRTTYAVGTGFVTGLGGIATMPVTIPAGLAASYAIGSNTVAAIAHLRGYDIHSERVKTMILLCLIGQAGEEVLKTAGITIGTKVFQNIINQIPGKVLSEINGKVGFKLVTKAGEKGVINIMKLIPLVGGIVGGTFDGMFVQVCGTTAKKVFPQISDT